MHINFCSSAYLIEKSSIKIAAFSQFIPQRIEDALQNHNAYITWPNNAIIHSKAKLGNIWCHLHKGLDIRVPTLTKMGKHACYTSRKPNREFPFQN